MKDRLLSWWSATMDQGERAVIAVSVDNIFVSVRLQHSIHLALA